MPHIHWVVRQNKIEISNDEDGGSREFVSGSYSFPHHCMTDRVSVGEGLSTNLFLDW
jgi:hypothetical protein